jgi:hypothetical protein
LVALFISSRREANRRAAWDQFTYVLTSGNADLDALREAAQENPDTPMSRLANVTWADNELQLGTELFFRDQAAAETHLDNARSVYRELIDKSKDPIILNRARLGIARVLETEGKPQEAAEFYQAVRGPFAQFAQQRAKELTDASVQDSVTWLASAEMPEIEAPSGPGTPGARPPFGDFQLDPSIPAGSSAGIPAGSASGGVPDPLAPGGARSGQTAPFTAQEPLDFENPFARPSDPNRYATPPAEGGADEEATGDSTAPPDEGPATDAPAVVEPAEGSAAEDADAGADTAAEDAEEE